MNVPEVRGVRRTFDPEDIDRQTRKHMEHLPCFWPADWVAYHFNYALIDDYENISLFDYQPGGYEGHMYFTSRGRQAIDAAAQMIQWFFDNTNEDHIIGKTPIKCKGAWYLVRQLGFKRIGLISSEFCPLIHSRLTREEWRNNEHSR